MTIAVVTDSSACLEPGVARSAGITIAPLHVFVGGVDLREGVDDIPADFAADGPVTTAGSSPGELVELYGAALERSDGAGVVAVHISRGLSSTWDGARQAAAQLGDRVRVVDSAAAAMGVGYAALSAARVAAEGGTLDSVFAEAVAVSARTRCFIVVDRLDHLRRGGRIGAAAALLGTALAMKPVLHLADGKLVLKEKTRTSTKALGKLVEAVAAVSGESGVALTVHHMQCEARAATVASMLADRIPQIVTLETLPFGAVVGAHVGPGAVGVAVCPRA
ncbi:DegV family protein [Rhodococcus sp. PAMC28707]|uniref:DegV family protein n=1 Tax=unclassified Rhodococcus (in: high G+C Gram-positive bacteria) TaxID=192944 RepID=UPI00109DEA0B|nr:MULTISPECIES: DegV family protein [unclassified Rhodococcus (in: high G+C Gram-positive bacteria)]QCB51660.1 DegV family protein [Rhodococcus sp. PAMC28705]QCB60172.1 DegV family protein [Rhodococcus sp. PAMC28707]